MRSIRKIRFVFKNLHDLFEIFLPSKELPEKGKTRDTAKSILIFNWRDIKHRFAGGAEVYLHEIAKRLVRHGYNVTIFCGNDGRCQRSEVIDGVRIVRRGGFYLVYLWGFLYYLFKFRGRFDFIIDSQNGIPFFTPLFARIPVYCLIHHIHQEVFYRSLSRPLAFLASLLEKKAMPLVYKNTDFITVSPSSRKAIQRLRLTQRAIKIISPGVDLEKMKPGKKTKTPLILYLGRLKPYKSVDVLIRAFSLLARDFKEARLIIAGDGEERKKLESLVKRLALTERVVFKGKVLEKEKISLMQKAWVFVTPSFIEGWGLTTVEANACGTPVIASDVPGLRDSVLDGKTGFLFPYGNDKILAERILKLLTDRPLRKKMSLEARRWAENFSWEKSTARLIDILERRL